MAPHFRCLSTPNLISSCSPRFAAAAVAAAAGPQDLVVASSSIQVQNTPTHAGAHKPYPDSQAPSDASCTPCILSLTSLLSAPALHSTHQSSSSMTASSTGAAAAAHKGGEGQKRASRVAVFSSAAFPAATASLRAPIMQTLTGSLLPSATAATARVRLPFAARCFSSDVASLPAVEDSEALQALKLLLAISWNHLEEGVVAKAEKSLKETSDDVARAALESASSAAKAVALFLEKLEQLRMELDELSGGKFGGETVGGIPEDLKAALVSSLSRYSAYLDSFGAEEDWLRKKVQEEIGSALICIKQRCSGLGAEWNQISLLGTSGLSGSFIERRAA